MTKKFTLGIVLFSLLVGCAEGASQKVVPSSGASHTTVKDWYRLTSQDWNEAIRQARSSENAGFRMPLIRPLSEWDRREIVRGLKHWGFPTEKAEYRWPKRMARLEAKGGKGEAQWVCFGYKPDRFSAKVFDPYSVKGTVKVGPEWYVGIGAGGVYSQPKGERWETVIIRTGPHASDATYRTWLSFCINAYGLDSIRSLVRP